MSFRTTKSTVQNIWESIRSIKNYKPSFLFQSTDQYEQIDVTNFIFKLHSKLTVTILLLGTFFVTMKIFGNPIECIMKDNGVVTKQMMEHYCWIEGVFSIHTNGPTFNGLTRQSGTQGTDFAYPGVTSGPGRRVNHKYYQWIYFVLIIQAVMFYIPEYVWKSKENSQINSLILKLKIKPVNELSFVQQKIILQELFDTLLTSENFLTNFIFCEIYYIFNLVLQFWFTDILLGGSFRNLGWNWYAYANSDRQIDISYDPLVKVFPRLAKCGFTSYGPSGSLQTQDAVCFLTLNIVNEKIYVILWIWFLFLFLITSLHLVFHMMLVYSTTLRYLKLKYYAPKCNAKNLRILCKNAGNWFILEFVVVNLKPNYFTTLINSLFDEFYDKHGRPIVNQTVMDKYKCKRTISDNFPHPSTSHHHNDNHFDLPNNNYNQFNNQFTSNSGAFNQPSRNNFLTPSSPTNDLMIPSIITSSSSKFGPSLTATARRAKRTTKLRSSLSTSLAAKVGDSTWDNQSNQETAPFLNELNELDLEGAPYLSSTTGDRLDSRKSKLRDFKRTAKRDKASFGAQNETSLNLATEGFESFPMNSEDEWK